LRVRRLFLPGKENAVGVRRVEGDVRAFSRLKGNVVGLGTARLGVDLLLEDKLVVVDELALVGGRGDGRLAVLLLGQLVLAQLVGS